MVSMKNCILSGFLFWAFVIGIRCLLLSWNLELEFGILGPLLRRLRVSWMFSQLPFGMLWRGLLLRFFMVLRGLPLRFGSLFR